MATEVRNQSYYMVTMRFNTPLVENKPGFKFPDDVSRSQYLDYERKHWREKLHMRDSQVIIPRNAIHKTFIHAAQFLTVKTPSGFKMWRKFVEGCLMVIDDAVLEYEPKQLVPWETNVSSNGKMMVWTVRPMILLPISTAVKVVVVDDRLSANVLADLVDIAGRIIGFMSATKLGMGRAEIRVQPITREALK
jgi:hypothetical protein